MNDRRNFLVGAGSALLGAAALAGPAEAGSDDSLSFIYGIGIVWNPALPAPRGDLRLNVYLAILDDGTGTGTMSDPLHPTVNSRLRILRTHHRGNRFHFDGEIEASNDPAMVGQSFEVPAVVFDDGNTIINLRLNGDVFAGLGRVFRITNVRANASGLGGGGVSVPGQIIA